jgi:uncharacterized protein
LNLRNSVFNSVFARILRALAGAVCRRPNWFLIPQLVLFVACVIYTARDLQFDLSRDNLVGANKKYHQVFMQYRKEFPGEDELAVVVESSNIERNRQFIERLAAKLEAQTNLFTDVFFKGDLKALGPKALLFAPESDLTKMRQVLNDYRPFIREFTEATNLDSLFNLINRQFRTAKRETNADNNSMIKAIPALQRIIEQAIASLSMTGSPVSPGLNALFGDGDETEKRIYITFGNGRIYLVTARARSGELVPQAVERIRQLIQQTSFEVPGVNVGLTGEPVLDYDEMQQAQHDMTIASIVSLIICSLIFIYAYRGSSRPLKAVACLILGLGYTMGFTMLTVGHLNILTITFAPILTGLAIDFGIHFITRYEEEMRRGRTIAEAIDKAMVFTGQGIVTGALTTAGAFLAMGLTDFKGIQEMGIISGGGLALCLIPMMTLLPILLMHGRQHGLDHEVPAQTDRRARIEELWLRRPIPVMLIILALCGAAALQFHKVYFDYDLLHMQSQSLASVVYEKKLLSSQQSILFAALEADSLQQAREFEEKAKMLPSVASVDGDDKGTAVFELLTGDQTQKLQLVRSIKNEMSDLRFASIDTNAVRLEDLGATLYSTMSYCSLASNSVQEMQATTPRGPERSAQLSLAADPPSRDAQPDALARQLGGLHDAVSDLRVKMLSGDPAIPGRLLDYQEALFRDVQDTFEAIKTQDTGAHLRPEDLPPVIRNRFIGVNGKKFRVLVFPKNDIWQHDVQEQFVSQLRSVIPPDQVTGTPVQLLEYTTLLKDSYEQAAWYALAAIALMVLFHFRSLVCVILALLPVAIGTIWMGGIMGAAGIPFNPANIMTLPLVIGIGVTNGIHILNRFAEEQKAGVLAKSTGKAVLVSGLTAMTGFGTLILAKHQGIRSLGLVMSLGIGTCMIAGLTFLPALLNVLVRSGWTVQAKRPSAENARPLLAVEEPQGD